MGMPINSQAIISRTDPRITGGVSQIPTAPQPTPPVMGTQPVRGAVAAGPGGIPGASRGAGPQGIRRAPVMALKSGSRGAAPAWLRSQPAATGSLIGG